MFSKLDSERFNFPVAKAHVAEIRQIGGIEALVEKGFRFCIARCDTGDIAGCNWLEDNGFRLTDVQVCYQREIADLRTFPLSSPDTSLEYRPVAAYQTDQVLELVKNCFTDYGHYAADNRIDPDVCRDIYVDWARRSISDREVASIVMGAFREHELVGLLSLLAKKSNDGQGFAKGIMGAVDQSHRCRGVFKNLIYRCLIWGKENGHEWHEHNVLAANIPVNRSFQRMGFLSMSTFSTFHWWAD